MAIRTHSLLWQGALDTGEGAAVATGRSRRPQAPSRARLELLCWRGEKQTQRPWGPLLVERVGYRIPRQHFTLCRVRLAHHIVFVGQALPLRRADELRRPFPVAKFPVAVAVLKLAQVAVQVLLADVVVDAVDAAL